MTPADTSFQTLVLWVAALSTLVSFASVIWNIFSGPSKRNASKLEDHELRLNAIEQTLLSLPKATDMHELKLAVVNQTGKIETLTAIIERMEAVVIRHENHLLDSSRK